MAVLSAVENQLIELQNQIHIGNGAATLEPLKEIIAQYKQQHDICAHAQFLLAWVLWATNQYSAAEKTIRAALKLMNAEHPAYFPALLRKASIETSQNCFFKGLNTWLFILDHADSNQHPEIISEAYLGIGSYFQVKESSDLAETCCLYAYEFSKQGGTQEAQVKCGLYLLSAYCSSNKFAEAQNILDECWPILTLLTQADPVLYADMHHYTGITLAAQGHYEAAIKAIHHAQKINEDNQFLWGQTQNRIQLARIFSKQNKYNAAITQLESAILISSIFDHGVIQQEICGIIRDIHKANHNFAAALSAHEAFHQLSIKNRSYFSEETKNRNNARLRQLENRLEVIKKKQTETRLKATIQELQFRIAELSPLQTIDPLTGAPNQHYLNNDLSLPKSDTGELNINLLVSINNLFEINSAYGWEIGNRIIYSVYQSLITYFAQQETPIIRYHGQRFLILNVNQSDFTSISEIGNNFKKLDINENIKIEISISRAEIIFSNLQPTRITCKEVLWPRPAGDLQ